MQITVEISLYPLHSSYGETVLDFLQELRSHPRINIKTNQMSTQVAGLFEDVMQALQAAMKKTLSQEQKSAMIIKVFNENLDLDWIDFS